VKAGIGRLFRRCIAVIHLADLVSPDPVAAIFLAEFADPVLGEQIGQILDVAAVVIVAPLDAQRLDFLDLQQFFDGHCGLPSLPQSVADGVHASMSGLK